METSQTGSTLDERYELVRRIARGGGGTVWLAFDRVLAREIAVKQVEISDELSPADRESAKQRVLREAKAAARLGHPGVVTVYDVLDGGATVHLVMERVEAPTLQQVVADDGPLDDGQAARVGLELLDVLEAAHRRGIVHRDLKPSNVFLHPDGSAQLADFGIASVAGETSLTHTGTALGSPDYIAPEQAQGERPAPAADLWGLGATLYHVVEGVPPFERAGLIPTVQAVVNEPYRPFSRAQALRGVIEPLLRKEPAQRPDTEHLRSRLREVASGGASPPSTDAQTTQELTGVLAPPGPRPPHEGEVPDAAAEPGGSEAASDEAAPEVEETARRAPREASAVQETGPGPNETAQRAPVAAPAAQETAPQPDETSPGLEAGRTPTSGPRRLHAVVAAVVAVAALAGLGTWLGIGDPAGDEVAEAPADEQPPDGADADDQGGDADGEGSGGDEDHGDEGVVEEADAPDDPDGPPSVAEASSVPDDWEVHQGATYQVAVPGSWQEQDASGNRTDYVAPDTGAYLRVDHTDDPAPDPLEDWETAAADFSQRHEAYEELRLERVSYRDYDAAVWEYRYSEGGVPLRAVNLNIVDDDHAYALNLQSPEDDWDEVGGHLRHVTAGFQPDR